MTSEQYYELTQKWCDDARELSRRKNADYAAPDTRKDDPFGVFANFTAVERLGVCSTETGFMVRIMDKVVRIGNLIRPGRGNAVKDEAIDDTLADLHNYSLLFRGFLKAVKMHGRPTDNNATWNDITITFPDGSGFAGKASLHEIPTTESCTRQGAKHE